MSQVQVNILTPRHEAIMVYLIANPFVKKGDVARQFGVTQAWLSVLIHSDAFRARYDEMKKEFTSICLDEVKDKLTALAHTTLDKLIEQAEVMEDPRDLRETAKLALDRIGFAPTPTGVGAAGAVFNQNNFFAPVEASVLREARERIVSRQVGGNVAALPRPAPSPSEATESRGGD